MPIEEGSVLRLWGAKGGGLFVLSFRISAALWANVCRSLVAAKSESCCRRLFASRLSWVRACRSSVGSSTVFAWPTCGLLVASAMAKCSAVSASSVPACPMGTHTRWTPPQSFLSSSKRGWYLSVFSSSFALRLRSDPNPTSMSRREQLALSNEDGSGLGTLGTPLA